MVYKSILVLNLVNTQPRLSIIHAFYHIYPRSSFNQLPTSAVFRKAATNIVKTLPHQSAADRRRGTGSGHSRRSSKRAVSTRSSPHRREGAWTRDYRRSSAADAPSESANAPRDAPDWPQDEPEEINWPVELMFQHWFFSKAFAALFQYFVRRRQLSGWDTATLA